MVGDDQNPISKAKPITLYLDKNGQAQLTPSDIENGSSDNCGFEDYNVSPSSFTGDNLGENIVTYTVTDHSGNQGNTDVIITLIDTIRPVILTPDNLSLYLDENGQVTVDTSHDEIVLSDNHELSRVCITMPGEQCGSSLILSCDDISDNLVIEINATDKSGNSTMVMLNASLLDTIIPDLNLKSTTLFLDESWEATMTANDIIISTFDACGIVDTTISKTSFGCSDIGTHEVEVNNNRYSRKCRNLKR